MANKVVLKRSSIQGKSPTTSDIELGELALNTFDGDLFFKKDSGTASIVSVVTLDGTQTLTNKTLTSPVVGGITTSSTGNIVFQPASAILEVRGYIEESANGESEEEAVAETFAITVVNDGQGNIYAVDGVSKPILYLVRGGVYTFDQSDSSNSNHPIAFKDGNGNSYTSGVVSTGTPGQSGAQTVFTVPNDAPSSLRYYCTVHGDFMGNTISVSGGAAAPTEYPGQIQLNCPVNTHGQRISSQPHSQAASNTLTLPGGTIIGDANAVLVSDTGTQTLTNKTLNSAALTGTLTAGGVVGTNGSILTSTGNGVIWSTSAGGLGNLSDVTFTDLQPDQIIKYNGAIWVNSDPDAQASSSVVFAANAESDLGFVTTEIVDFSEDNGLVTDTAIFVFNLGSLVVDGIVSLSNLDQSVKADYISYAIIFGF